MSVYIDVWHRTLPLAPENHQLFLDYYGEWVVGPPSDFFEVVGGFRYTDGESNTDFVLYRYESMGMIEKSMMSFGAGETYIAATTEVFSQIQIEETRAVAIHSSYCPEARLDEVLAEGVADPAMAARRYVRIVRRLPTLTRPQAFLALGQFAGQVEKASGARLVAAFEYLVGPVTDGVEIWVLPEGQSWFPALPAGVDPALSSEIARLAPEQERRGIEPTVFSKLR
ncbi:MAG: hypothetical protein CL908_19655 [Deltaproteobacteria bacterium]|jgi:hypothetical protein|nr:hypothetical protein [Deltaproteobacteria bacterium]